LPVVEYCPWLVRMGPCLQKFVKQLNETIIKTGRITVIGVGERILKTVEGQFIM